MSIRVLSKDLQEIAAKELNEIPEKVPQDLEIIRKWAEGKPHIKLKDDQWLLNFLRVCKFDLEVVKEKLSTFCEVKQRIPEFFASRDPLAPEIQRLLDLGVALPLPKLASPDAPRVILIRFGPADPTQNRIEDGLKMGTMLLDVLLHEDENVRVSGAHMIFDNNGLTIKHIFQVTPGVIRKMFRSFIDGYPTRPRGCHIINAPRIAKIAFETFKRFFSSQLLDMTRFYDKDEMEDFHTTIPLSILPKEYGGEGETLQELISFWKKKIESYREWFLEDDEFFAEDR